MIGTGNGPYSLETAYYDTNGTLSFDSTFGVVQTDQVVTHSLPYSTDPGTPAAILPLQEGSDFIRYNNWLGGVGSLASEGTYRFSRARNSTVSLTFKGTSVTWLTRKGPDAGRAQVLIDGVNKGTFDLYSAAVRWNVQQKFAGLANRTHRLQIRVLGTRNALSSNNFVYVDGFALGNTRLPENDRRVCYNGWCGSQAAGASGGEYRKSATRNATLALKFEGPSITWVTARGPRYGMAEVRIDGVLKGIVDLYAPSQQWQVAQTFDNLGVGPHTITIKVLGQKNAASAGFAVVFDSFDGAIAPLR